MNGGTFDYNQYKIRDIAETIERELNRQGTLKNRSDLWFDSNHYSEYPDDKFYPTYSLIVQQIFKDAIEILKKAEIYAERIDKYIANDDGEKYLIKKLDSDLKKLKDDQQEIA